MSHHDETEEACSICLSPLTKNIVKPYDCIHSFHSECISSWKGSCPLCRKSKYIGFHYPLNQHDEKCFINITIMENNSKKISDINHINKYKNVWKIKSCVNENHNLIFIETYGAMGICKTCNRIQAFNLMH